MVSKWAYHEASCLKLNRVTPGFLRLCGRKTGLLATGRAGTTRRSVLALPIATKPNSKKPVSDFPHFAVFQNVQHEPILKVDFFRILASKSGDSKSHCFYLVCCNISYLLTAGHAHNID